MCSLCGEEATGLRAVLVAFLSCGDQVSDVLSVGQLGSGSLWAVAGVHKVLGEVANAPLALFK